MPMPEKPFILCNLLLLLISKCVCPWKAAFLRIEPDTYTRVEHLKDASLRLASALLANIRQD
jgi:hypothetical protein